MRSMLQKNRILLIASVFILYTHSLYAKKQPEVALGLIQGVVYPTMSFQPEVVQQASFQYHGGIALRYIAEKNVGIQAELSYSQRGWTESSSSSESFSKQIDYIELPLLTHIYIGREKTRFFIQLGPKIRYAIQEKNTNTYTNSTEHQHITPIENSFDYSLLGGIGLEIRTKKIGYFQLETRYDFGIGDVYSNRKADHFSRSSNQGIIASINYFFPIFKNK